MGFLPKDYKAPAGSSDYFKLIEGENKVRILTDPIIGWEGWVDGKPFRRKGEEKNIEDDEVEINKLSKKPAISPVWSMLVWDYEESKVKVWNLTQKTIMSPIVAMNEDKAWGDAKGYDIVIERVDGNRVSYNVRPSPPKKLDKEIVSAVRDTELDPENSFGEPDEREVKAKKKFKDF